MKYGGAGSGIEVPGECEDAEYGQRKADHLPAKIRAKGFLALPVFYTYAQGSDHGSER